MGSDDMIVERRPANHTPAIALGVAALLLLIVGGLSYRDYVRRSYEKEFAEKEREMMARQGYVQWGPRTYVPQGAAMPNAPAPANLSQPVAQVPGNVPPPVSQPAGPAGPAVAANAAGVQSPAASPGVSQPAGSSPGAREVPAGDQATRAVSSSPAPAPASDPARFPREDNLPEPDDPVLSQFQDSLDRAREQAAETEQRYRELTGEAGRAANRYAAESDRVAVPAGEEITEELPAFLREALEEPPGGNPDVEQRMARLREQVRLSPALARVTSYNNDWGLVTFNAGSSQGVALEQRYAVRRGDDILGWVRVEEVQPNAAVAVLVTKNRNADTALKPEPGDDLIKYELE